MMEEKLSPKQRMDNYMGWITGLSNRIYHLTGYVTFGPVEGYQISFENANRRMINFIKKAKASEDLDIACFYAICRKAGRVHVHFLAILQRHQKPVLDVDPQRLQRLWPHKSEIERAVSQIGAIKYLASQFLHNLTCHMEWYNHKLLQKALIQPDHGRCIGGSEDAARAVALLDEE